MVVHTVSGAGGVDLRVEDVGSGRPILFVHGYSQSRLCWRNQFESELAETHRLIAPDLRGHGASAKPHDAYADSETWARDLEAIIDALELSNVVLVAWSYGGLVALDYVETCGTSALDGINLVGGVVSIGTPAATERLGDGYLDLVDGFLSTDVEESTRTMAAFVDLCVADELSPADRYQQLGYNVVVPPHVRDALRDRTVTHESDLENLDIPVLLSHGDVDAVVVPSAAETYAALLDDVDLSWYAGVGHSPFWERPDRFTRELREFADGL